MPRRDWPNFLPPADTARWTWLGDARRANPTALWPEAGSVVMVGMNYGPDRDPLASLAEKDRATISVYAANRDYHDLIKGKLKVLAGRFKARTGSEVKVFVDTAPLMEKPLAAAAGLGWQGKHTNLVSRAFGSWMFLGAIVTEMRLPPDEAGEATAAAPAAPASTSARRTRFPRPISSMPAAAFPTSRSSMMGRSRIEFRKAMGNRIYGCDDCLAVCPWNKFAQVTREAKLAARADRVAPPLGGAGGDRRRGRISRALFRLADQAHRPRSLSSATS